MNVYLRTAVKLIVSLGVLGNRESITLKYYSILYSNIRILE